MKKVLFSNGSKGSGGGHKGGSGKPTNGGGTRGGSRGK